MSNQQTLIYQHRIESFSLQQARFRRKLKSVPWVRLALFFLMIFLIVLFTNNPVTLYVIAAVASFGGFVFAGIYDVRLKRKMRKLEELININRQEIDALKGDYSVFESGSEFIDHQHPYTHDLDIFGIGSVFQYINRTSTIFGKIRLSGFFQSAFFFRENIRVRQYAVEEISRLLDFRQKIQQIFFTEDISENDLTELTIWLEKGKRLHGTRVLKIVAYIIPLATLAFLVLSIMALIPYHIPLFLIILQLLFAYAYGRHTQIVHQAITSKFNILEKYAEALTLLEETSFSSDYTKSLKSRLNSDNTETPGQVIKRLAHLLNWMDSNLNLVASVFLNGLLMFNIHMLIAVDNWRFKNRKLVPRWFDILAEYDAISSLATFAFNNPEFIFPEPVSGDFLLDAREIGHPLIRSDECVTNDIHIQGWNQFCIITGANMSGKSTFLRTVGVNFLLAMMGAPVFAQAMRFTPIEIHSSIRTIDSLVKRESYFYAELKRLKEIIDELESGKKLLILLDEILKGTNSKDKRTGSIALIKQLMNYRLAGMFATHDLALGDLITYYPDHIKNLCFEISIENDRMEIDYKLRPGVCKNLNASFLMEKMGIILDK
ncbi:MAG: hypothetical protein HQ542_06890 [Bacteroidia bacterium]|nr:hypothetical protein [Bacteroidia bacterium]